MQSNKEKGVDKVYLRVVNEMSGYFFQIKKILDRVVELIRGIEKEELKISNCTSKNRRNFQRFQIIGLTISKFY